MNLRFRYPSDERVTWSTEAARSAVGKPLMSRPTDGVQIGVVTQATVTEDGALEIECEVYPNTSSVEYNLATNLIDHVSFVPMPVFPA